MAFYLRLYPLLLIILLAVDMAWIGLVANKFYLKAMAPFGRIENGSFQIVVPSAVLVYLLLTAGIICFPLARVTAATPWWGAALWGAGFGLVAYGVYDLTNHATVKNYPLYLAVVDMCWGAFICAFGTVVAKWLRDHWASV